MLRGVSIGYDTFAKPYFHCEAVTCVAGFECVLKLSVMCKSVLLKFASGRRGLGFTWK